MPSFPYVKKGDAFKPNLELDNAVRRMVNENNGLSGGKSNHKNSFGKVAVYNSSDEMIEAGNVVCFPAGVAMADDVIPCKKSASVTEQFGILTSDLAPDEVGSCVISGPVKVEISGGGNFASPDPANPGKMIAGTSGSPVVFRISDTAAIVNLGGGSGSAVDEYNGPFKLQAVSPTEIEIVCGPNPSADFSGHSDVPGFYDVPKLKVTVDIATAGTYIYLYFDYNKETKKYSAHLDIGSVPKDIILFRRIGGINQGKIYQSYKIDGQMRFSDDFYLTPGEDN
jgi:hypothetical protein